MTLLLGFIVTIIIVVGVHELGHYLAARSCNVRVLKFAIGFGYPLASWVDKKGTEWCLGIIPLGGYVQMVHDPAAAKELNEPAHRSLEGRPLWQRSWVVGAGPLANFVFAMLMFYLAALLGETGLRARIGEVVADSPAAIAGFVPGEDIIAVDGKRTLLWSKFYETLFSAIADHDLQVMVQAPNGVAREVTLPTAALTPSVLDQDNLLEVLGLVPDRSYITLAIDQVLPDSPAATAGMLVGDVIIAANGQLMNDWEDFTVVIRDHPELEFPLIAARDNQEVALTVVPRAVAAADGFAGWLGVVPQIDLDRHAALLVTQREGPFVSLGIAVQRTWVLMATTVRYFFFLVRQEVSSDNLSGPIGIAQIAGQALNLGYYAFVIFLAQISISLGIINLMPIPILDGGHLLRYAIEGVIRRPLPDKIIRTAGTVGVAVLLALMFFALYNDLT